MLTVGTNALRIGVSSSPHDASANVKQEVVGMVFANDKIGVPIVLPLVVYVMNTGVWRESFFESLLCN